MQTKMYMTSDAFSCQKDIKHWANVNYSLNVKSGTEFMFTAHIGKCKLMHTEGIVRAQRLESSKQKYNQLKSPSNTLNIA